jgi:hypothetical protein
MIPLRFSLFWSFLLVLVLVLTSCNPAVPPEAAQTQVPTMTPPPPLPQATATEQPTRTPPEMPGGPGTIWNLVIIGDSSLWRHGTAIASQIEKDMGIEVKLNDFALPALQASTVLYALQTGESSNMKLQSLPDAVKEAQMVVMFVNPTGSLVKEKPLNLDGCFMMSPPKACEMETYAQYTVDLKAIWAKIIELRAGQPTILRATDIYNPLVDDWSENNILDACNQCWGNMSAAARQAAEAYNIPFLSRYDAYNGLDHHQDPKVMGYIAEDGEHPSEQGAEYTAQLLSEMGYEPTIP